jgi:hypothetical protein
LRRSDLERDLRAILEARRRITFFFARFDPGYDLLMMDAARFVTNGAVRASIIDGGDHTFEAKEAREKMIAALVAHLRERYAASESRAEAAGRFLESPEAGFDEHRVSDRG